MPFKKEIIYPIFLECSPHTKDTFWENVFEDLAYGKTPYGTYISKDFLCCSYRKKDFSYKIERKDVKQVYDEVYKLLAKKLGLSSPQERARQKKAFDEIEENMRFSRNSWSSIRKKNIKELLIEIFVTRMKNKYSLSLKQSRHLLSSIFMAMVFKVITSNDIEYKDSGIQAIKGINFSKGKVIFKRDLYNIKAGITPTLVLDKKKRMSDNWIKYIKELKKVNN
jgi:hypothetical protein